MANKKTKKTPKLPKDKLDKFVQEKVNLRDGQYLLHIRDAFLWDVAGVERYRVDVWVEEDSEGCLYRSNRIGASFFVHYKMGGTIQDKTIEVSEENREFFK